MPLVLPLDWQHLLSSGGKLDNGKLPATGFDYVATSGEVKTGQGVTFPWSALKFEIWWAGIPHVLFQCIAEQAA
jgi:hypothetical protein